MSPRKRANDNGMPAYVYWKNGAWRLMAPPHLRMYLPGQKTWYRLGLEKQEALLCYSELMGNLTKESGMAKLLNRYQAEVIPHKAPRTQKDNLKELIKLRGVFEQMHPTQITTQHCQQYLDHRGKQSRTQANHEIALLSHVFRKAMQWGIVTSNPVKGVEKHKIKARDRYVEDWELEALLSVAPTFIRAYVEFKLLTGLRQGDILALPLNALRDDGIAVKTRKTGRRGLISWIPELRKAVADLKACNQKQGLTLICDRAGKPLGESAFHNRWGSCMREALAASDLTERFTEHDLRAKHATDLDKAGGNATDNLLHDDKRMTDTYLRARRSTRITPMVRKKAGK
jgi:integrase